MRPVIGVFAEVKDDFYSGVRRAYIRAIEDSGGVPMLIPYLESDEALAEAIAAVDGVLFSGGADISPSRYGEAASERLGELEVNRDELDFRAFAIAHRLGVPILGICRGAQMINVALGGSLYQDIPSEYKSEYKTDIAHRQSEAENEPSHGVTIISGTGLSELIGKDRMAANSFHHQAIRRLGDGLCVTALADDGIIEGYEYPGERYLSAFQWHPERLASDNGDSKRIFEDFILAAQRYKSIKKCDT